MGWFGSSASEPTAVSREGRQHCWDSRDAYFACLDNDHVLKPGDEGKACVAEKTAYEKNCAKSWVRCFPLPQLRQPRIQIGSRLNISTKDAYWLNSRRAFCNR